MPVDSQVVVQPDLAETVRGIVCHVLMLPPADVHLEDALSDLGAESIDYLDLVFRIEEALGKRVPMSNWEAFIRDRLPGADLSGAITVATFVEFAERERARPLATS